MKRRGVLSSKDAIVDEVRAVRADLSAQYGNDIPSLCEHLREVEAKYKARVVHHGKGSPRRPGVARKLG